MKLGATIAILILALVGYGATITRIINLPETTNPRADDFINVDRDTSGTRKLKLGNLLSIGTILGTKSNLTELASFTGGTNGQTLYVQGYTTIGDWGEPKAYTLNTSTNLIMATNMVAITNIAGTGKWIHQWDGDASAFGVLTGAVDNGTAINTANAVAIAQGIPLLLGEGTFTITNWVSLVTGSHIKGKGIGKTVLVRNSALSSQTNDHRYATLQTPGVFNPYSTNGGHGPTVTPSVSNIVLEGFSLGTKSGSYSGFGVALFATDSAIVRDVEFQTHTNHWCLTVLGNRTTVSRIRVRNSGAIYQDGVHFLGGEGFVLADSDIESGDDAFAVATGDKLDVKIRDVTATGNYLYSTHAHAIRINQENPSATNTFEGFEYVGNVGRGGIVRNAAIRITSASTNFSAGTFPIKNITVANSRFRCGTASEHSLVNPYGAYVQDATDIKFIDVHLGSTIFPTWYVFDCGNVEMRDCSGYGGQSAGFANALHAANVVNLRVTGGEYRNDAAFTTTPIALNGCSNVVISGVYLTNSVASRGVIQTLTTNSQRIVINDSYLGAPDTAVLLALLPTYFYMVGNVVYSPNNVLFDASYTIPENYVVENNDGQPKVRGFLSAKRFDVLKSSGDAAMSWIDNQQDAYLRMVNTNGLFVIAPTTNNAVGKIARIGMTRYNSDNTPLGAMVLDDSSGSFPILGIGGGSSSVAQNMWVNIHATGTNATAGNTVGRFEIPTTSDSTGFSLPAKGIEQVILTLSFTNLPVVGDSLTINTTNRTWAAAETSTAFATNATISGSASSLRAQLVSYPITNLTSTVSGTNVTITAKGATAISGVSMVGNWATATLTTNKLALGKIYVGAYGTGPGGTNYGLYLRFD